MTYGKPYANDKFEEIGVKLIANSGTFKEMCGKFDKACTCCHFRSRTGDCKACPIRETLLTLAEAGWSTLTPEEQEYVNLERNSCDD